jgi:hypothetical protein
MSSVALIALAALAGGMAAVGMLSSASSDFVPVPCARTAHPQEINPNRLHTQLFTF